MGGGGRREPLMTSPKDFSFFPSTRFGDLSSGKGCSGMVMLPRARAIVDNFRPRLRP